MKKKHYFFILFISIFLASCKQTPNGIVKDFVSAAQKNNATDMNNYYSNGKVILDNEFNSLKIDASDFRIDSVNVFEQEHSKDNVVTTLDGGEVKWFISTKEDDIKISTTKGLFKLDNKKIASKYGLSDVEVRDFNSDIKTITAIEKIQEVIDYIQRAIIENSDYVAFLDIQNSEKLQFRRPSSLANFSLLIESAAPDIKYTFKSKDFVIVLTYYKQFRVDSTKGFVDPNCLPSWISFDDCDDTDIPFALDVRKAGASFKMPSIKCASRYADVTCAGVNYSKKTIKYIDWYVIGKNSVGDLVRFNTGQTTGELQLTGPIEPGEPFVVSFSLTFKNSVSEGDCIGARVVYMDGTIKSLAPLVDDLSTNTYKLIRAKYYK